MLFYELNELTEALALLNEFSRISFANEGNSLIGAETKNPACCFRSSGSEKAGEILQNEKEMTNVIS